MTPSTRSHPLPIERPFTDYCARAGRSPSERGTRVSDEEETKSLQEEFRAKTGLEILFAKQEPGDGLDGLREWDILKELRERYWIRMAEDIGEKRGPWTVAIRGTLWIERQDIGRDRNDSGDGFRYVYRLGTDGMESRAEWFEVTEAFEGVKAKDIEAFMLVNNGGTADSNFDPDTFLSGLDMEIPCRSAQRRAADRVIDAVAWKLNHPPYQGMWREHGYGTLVVGLPLWFAAGPADPLRAENVIDDFRTRVTIGLKPYARQLKKKSCPFWRIVVVWMASRESLSELRGKVRYDVYDDPAHRKIRGLQVKLESYLPLLSKIMSKVEEARRRGEKAGWVTRSVAVAHPKKQGAEPSPQLPSAVEALKQALERADTRRLLDPPLERARWRAKRRALDVLCFLRVHGLSGLSRWATNKLSPHHRIARLAIRDRELRLYRVSRRRRAAKGGPQGLGTRTRRY